MNPPRPCSHEVETYRFMDTSIPTNRLGLLSALIHVALLGTMFLVPIEAAVSLSTRVAEYPVLRGKPINPVLEFTVQVGPSLEPQVLESVELEFSGSSFLGNISQVHLCMGADSSVDHKSIVASARPSERLVVLTPGQPLSTKNVTFWISVSLTASADINDRVALQLRTVRLNGQRLKPPPETSHTNQRIGVALRQRHEDGANSYRIPGIARSIAGSLIAVYDIRREHCRDLPARIDIGVSRSTNDGQTWSPMTIAMTPALLGSRYASGGIGDPAILVDRTSGRIWVAALWCHGDIGWEKSRPGMSPEETGQLLLTFSDDDGQTWSPPRNLTASVKDYAWRLCFSSPGAGICMQDGTLVFPAMFRAADGGETQGKPFATILVSRDQGTSWQIGTGAKMDTTESQVAQLSDGTLMLNARDNRGQTRTVVTTQDLGRTWSPHATDRVALVDPVCMAGFLSWAHPKYGPLLLFSNPANPSERRDLSLKISRDQGLSWPRKWELKFDSRAGSGYSCLAEAGTDHIGILYEGKCEINFVRIPLSDVLN
ncbi:MAG: exo-alpha-sialidase [Opitutaceae bacterium]|nr:exo-alpha-sialidase [Opitutaceae bacterium]